MHEIIMMSALSTHKCYPVFENIDTEDIAKCHTILVKDVNPKMPNVPY
jgi:hypothetical protein